MARMNKWQYIDGRLQNSVRQNIQSLIKNDAECQKTLAVGKKKTEALRDFCQANDINIIAPQLYSMNAKTRRTLKINVIEVVRQTINEAVWDL